MQYFHVLFLLCVIQVNAMEEQSDPQTEQSFHEAIRKNDLKMLERMILLMPYKINTIEHSLTPISLACLLNNIPAAKMLLEKGANPNIPLSETKTYPLHIAATLDDWQLTVLLIEHNADLAIKNDQNLTAYECALNTQKNKNATIILNELSARCKIAEQRKKKTKDQQLKFYFVNSKHKI